MSPEGQDANDTQDYTGGVEEDMLFGGQFFNNSATTAGELVVYEQDDDHIDRKRDIRPAVMYKALSRHFGIKRTMARRISLIGSAQATIPARDAIIGEEESCWRKVWISVSLIPPVYRNRKMKK